jgi:hypothetical protein
VIDTLLSQSVPPFCKLHLATVVIVMLGLLAPRNLGPSNEKTPNLFPRFDRMNESTPFPSHIKPDGLLDTFLPRLHSTRTKLQIPKTTWRTM